MKAAGASEEQAQAAAAAGTVSRKSLGQAIRPHGSQARSAEEIVTAKLTQFARDRRAIAQALAQKLKVEVPSELDPFFDAVESGRWEEIQARFTALREARSSVEGLNLLWGPVLETYGVAEVSHDWPAQRLLDYGQAVLGSLKPGMVYSGGTDPGRFIPTLLDATSDGERHVILTQNALADNSYLQYFDFLYHDQLATLSGDDSQRAFNEYLSDAQKRLTHDQQSPNEPKQVRPGEDLQFSDGRFQVSGQVAVMAINERLFQMLMDKNPNLSFALEESFPFKSMYGAAVPLGPVMELGSSDSQAAYSPESASQAAGYWASTAQSLVSDSELAADSEVRKAYSKLASAQAGLLEQHNQPAAAEQAYQAANQICPSSPEAVFRYVNFLMSQNRQADALAVVQNAFRSAPGNPQFQDLIQNLKRSVASGGKP